MFHHGGIFRRPVILSHRGAGVNEREVEESRSDADYGEAFVHPIRPIA